MRADCKKITASKSKRLNTSKLTDLSRANLADVLNLDRNTVPNIRNITARKLLAVDIKIYARFAIRLADSDKVQPSRIA